MSIKNWPHLKMYDLVIVVSRQRTASTAASHLKQKRGHCLHNFMSHERGHCFTGSAKKTPQLYLTHPVSAVQKTASACDDPPLSKKKTKPTEVQKPAFCVADGTITLYTPCY